MLEIEGNVTRDPATPSPTNQVNCGRTGHPFSRVDNANRSLYLVKPGGVPLGGNDFDRVNTWIVVWDRLVPEDNACGSRPALWAAERDEFAWTFAVNGGAFNISIGRGEHGVALDGDTELEPGSHAMLRREFTANGGHTWSDITFRLHGGWSTADVHDVDSEQDLPNLGAGAAWHRELPS